VAKAEFGGYTFHLTDLPGTYSLSCYSPEELYVRQHLKEQVPDVVINVLDASNLERNLYLTTQLVDMNLRMVCALNFFDEFERRGDTVNLETLSSLFGVPMVPTSFKSGRGVSELFQAVIDVFEEHHTHARHVHINYGHEIEAGIKEIQKVLKPDEHIAQRYSTRYLSIKLLEHDTAIEHYIGYKGAVKLPPEFVRQFSRLAGMLEMADDEFSRLRTTMTDYRRQVQALVKSGHFSEVSLSSDSFQQFLDLKPFDRLNQRIAAVNQAEIFPAPMMQFLPILESFRFTNLGDIQQFIVENSEDAYQMAVSQLAITDLDILSETVGLQNLCLV
jgi:Fe2+ transport system protein B